MYPLPSKEDVDFYYQHIYYEDTKWFEKELDEYCAGLWSTAYKFQANLLGNQKLIDWGAGSGLFVFWWGNYVKSDCYGIEPSERARNYFYMSNVVPDSVFIPSGKYNIRASLLFEHLVDPLETLRNMRALLNKRILIIVPNDGEGNALQKRVGGTWWVDKSHLNYFSPRGLTALARKANLKIAYRGATFPMELFILMGFDYRNDSSLGRKCHNIRLNFEKKLGVTAFKLYQLLHKFGWGRELLYVLEKDE